MKLLFDQNLSRKLVGTLEAEYPDSTHVAVVGLDTADDRAVWQYAAQHELVLVSKDNDFAQLAFLFGAPPKVVWVRVGNSTSATVADVLRDARPTIATFVADPDEALLVLS